MKEKQRIQALEKEMDQFEIDIAPVIKGNELEREKHLIWKLINSLKGHERDLMEKGNNILSTRYLNIIEFDDEIVMRFSKGANHEHQHQAGESLGKIEGNRQGNQKICKIKPGGASQKSV